MQLPDQKLFGSRISARVVVCVAALLGACAEGEVGYETIVTELEVDASDMKELRSAIVAARDNGEDDIIYLTGSLYKIATEGCPAEDDDQGLVGDLDIVEAGHSVRIVGGANVSIVSSCQDIRVFEVFADASLELENVTVGFGGGSGLDEGGLIRSEGKLDLDHVHLNQGKAENGGAVYTTTSGALTMTNSVAWENTAVDAGGAFYFARGSHTITESVVRENVAGRGGGIAQIGGVVVLSDTDVRNNSADDGDGYASGGGISATATFVFEDGVISLERPLLQVLGGAFSDNKAYWGAAISGQFTDLRVEDAEFYGQIAGFMSGAINLSYSGSGYIANTLFEDNTEGAVSVFASTTLQAYHTTWSDNHRMAISASSNSAIILGGCTLTGTDGSALDGYNSTAHISETLFADNDGFEGGAISWSQYQSEHPSFLDIERSSFVANRARQFGGAIHLVRTSTAVSNSTFAGNRSELGLPGNTISTGSLGTGEVSTVELNSVTMADSVGGNAEIHLHDAYFIARRSYLESTGPLCNIDNSEIAETSFSNYTTDDSCGLPDQPQVAANIVGPAAALEPLGLAGGVTPVFVPQDTGSNPIIDSFANALCGTVDQRGQQRPLGSGCDYGAVEASDTAIIYAGQDYPAWEPPSSPDTGGGDGGLAPEGGGDGAAPEAGGGDGDAEPQDTTAGDDVGKDDTKSDGSQGTLAEGS